MFFKIFLTILLLANLFYACSTKKKDTVETEVLPANEYSVKDAAKNPVGTGVLAINEYSVKKAAKEKDIYAGEIPPRIKVQDILAGIDTKNITDEEITCIKQQLMGCSIDTGGQMIDSATNPPKTVGWLAIYGNDDNIAIFAYERYLGVTEDKRIYQCEDVIIYPHKGMNLFDKEVAAYYTQDEPKNYTFWGLYKYPLDYSLGFEQLYYPQDVIIIDSETGTIRLVANENKKYVIINNE
jgi:hypothetical protein